MPKLITLASFDGANGRSPYSATLLIDASGNLLGTAANGGNTDNGYGTVFEIAKTAIGYDGTLTTLADFDGADGYFPLAGLITDANGNLFGTTNDGSLLGYGTDGTVFEIAKTADGYATSPQTLVRFNGNNGSGPIDRLMINAEGDLFGTTSAGGTNNDGTVFEISKTAGGYDSAPTTLANFDKENGSDPYGSVIADSVGDLFGVTRTGGQAGSGVVYEIPKTGTGYASPLTLATFSDSNGGEPTGALVSDANGDIFGTSDGGADGDGTVYEIAKTINGYANQPTTLVTFDQTGGEQVQYQLLIDGVGNLFGTTRDGGSKEEGTVYEVAKTATGYSSDPITLTNFKGVVNAENIDIESTTVNDVNGTFPSTALTVDAAGNLFGMTQEGGVYGDGTVFELTDTGYGAVASLGGPGDDGFVIDGSKGVVSIDGQGGVNFIDTSAAAGTGTVTVDLENGVVSRGGQVDTILTSIQGVQLGADSSVVQGLATGLDIVYGATGDVSVVGNGAEDVIKAGSGSVTVQGGTGNEILYGGGGHDMITGGSGETYVLGGTGTDSSVDFNGTTGRDFLYGQSGTLLVKAGTGPTYVAGGSGTTMVLGDTDMAGLLYMDGGSGSVTLTAGIGTNVLVEGSGATKFNGSSGVNGVFGGTGQSDVQGGSGTLLVTTGAGNQHVMAGSGHTYFNDTEANQTAGRHDIIDNFADGQGTDLYLATAVQGQTTFEAESGGTAVVTAVKGGAAEIFASGADLATVQAHTHFTL